MPGVPAARTGTTCGVEYVAVMIDDSTLNRGEYQSADNATGVQRRPGRARPLSIGDIAHLAGVSIGTVSRALNGRAGIASATRERILQIVEETGFVRNPSARHLVGSRAGIIEVVVCEIQ